jgi:hypothetical protein
MKTRETVKQMRTDDGEVIDGMYLYKGYRIRRHDDVPNGYWGRWSVGNRAYTTDSRADCIRWIDKRKA